MSVLKVKDTRSPLEYTGQAALAVDLKRVKAIISKVYTLPTEMQSFRLAAAEVLNSKVINYEEWAGLSMAAKKKHWLFAIRADEMPTSTQQVQEIAADFCLWGCKCLSFCILVS